jgi:hypothetical protein
VKKSAMQKFIGLITQLCVKIYITCTELWVGEVYEMIAVEVKGRGPKIAWEIIGIYRVPKENMRLLEKLADQTVYMGSYMKRSITGGILT